MKNWFFVVVFFYCFSGFSDDSPIRVGTLSSGIIMKNEEGYFFLSDGSCWKVIGLSKRDRSIKEWWNKVKLPVPQNYECAPKDWASGVQIEVFPKDGNSEVYAEYATNKEDLRQCTHLLINLANRQVLFALSVEPCACIAAIYQDAYDKGYNTGYNQGNATSEQKYTTGYELGYQQGYQIGAQQNQQSYQQGYQQGWIDYQRQQQCH
jgi:hypothetical protein